MSEKSSEVGKQSSQKKAPLIAGLIWFGLGLFGLIFDPSKMIIIISQFIAGLIFIGYYYLSKLK